MKWKPIAELDRTQMWFGLAAEDGAVRCRLWNPRGYWEDDMGRRLRQFETCSSPEWFMDIPDVPDRPITSEDTDL